MAAAACTARAAPGVEMVGVELAIEQAVEVADAQRAEHEDLRAHAGSPQHRPLFDVGAREQIRAGVFERACHLPGAVPVRVGLDHRNHAGADRAIAQLAAKEFDDAPVVRLKGA